MTPEQYCKALEKLGWTQEYAGEYFGMTGRTGQNWAKNGPPKAVEMVIKNLLKER